MYTSNQVNEYDQIRNSLAKIRSIQESQTHRNSSLNENFNQPNVGIVNADDSNQEVTQGGEKITFDGLNTVGFLNSQEALDDGIKNQIGVSVGEFIKATGLLLDSMSINIQNGRMIITSETVKNPGIANIKSFVIDTEKENSQLNVISGTIEISSDFVTLLTSIGQTYNDPQIGRTSLVSSTQISQNQNQGEV